MTICERVFSLLLFPAQAGMILKRYRASGDSVTFPRASGDDPQLAVIFGKNEDFSPRKRG